MRCNKITISIMQVIIVIKILFRGGGHKDIPIPANIARSLLHSLAYRAFTGIRILGTWCYKSHVDWCFSRSLDNLSYITLLSFEIYTLIYIPNQCFTDCKSDYWLLYIRRFLLSNTHVSISRRLSWYSSLLEILVFLQDSSPSKLSGGEGCLGQTLSSDSLS